MPQQRYKVISKPIRDSAIRAVMNIRGDDKLEVVIRPIQEGKTNEQRSWWHVMLRFIAGETGYTENEVKELVKKQILGTKTIRIGGAEQEVTESSEEKQKPEYSVLIEHTYRLAAEAGILIPTPEKDWP